MGILSFIFKMLFGSGGQSSSQQQTTYQSGGFNSPSSQPFQQSQKYYCKYCGMEYNDVRTLINNVCQKNPAGRQGFRHELYEGGAKSQYTCKYCGKLYRNLRDLTNNYCQHNPTCNKFHEPAL